MAPRSLSLTCLALALGLAACAAGGETTPAGPAAAADLGEGPAPDLGGDDLGPSCDPAGPGCPCVGEQLMPCYTGPTGTLALGQCAGGKMACTGGRFAACLGEILPEAERCDGLDNDCDGEVDEGLEACEPCAPPDCELLVIGPGGDLGFAEGQALGGEVRVTDGGELSLQAEERVLNDVWIANTDEGTVSRLDAASGRELGRYASVLPGPGIRPWDEPCDKLGGHGNCPSRTAVTLKGDVFVANRAFGGQGSVTRILGAGCPDRDGDGEVRTSSDVDGDGRISLADPEEFLGAADECLAFTTPVGPINGVMRALAVDPFNPPGAGSVWVGAYEEKAIYQLHAETGEQLRRLALPLRPYGALMGRDGTLWITALAGFDDALVSVNGATGQVGPAIPVENSQSCSDHRSKGGYGITIDGVGRVWIGGWTCEAALRYDPVQRSWFSVQLPNVGYTRGLAADAAGYIWVAHSHEAVSPYPMIGRVTRFRAEDGGDRRSYELVGQRETIGVGIDSAGKVWAVSKSTDAASRIDPVTHQVEHFPVGRGPYTYSDFTGYSLRTFVSPAGLWVGTLRGCPERGRPLWRRMRWESVRPAGTRLQLWLRAANHPSELEDAYRYGPFEASPVDLEALELPRASYLRVEVEMEALHGEAAPSLGSVAFELQCPPEG